MNQEIFKRLQDQCWIYHTHPDMIDTDDNGNARPCGFDTKKFAKLIVRECAEQVDWILAEGGKTQGDLIRKHFGVEEPQGWVCPTCGTDRTQSACPRGHTAALTGDCPMYGVAQ